LLIEELTRANISAVLGELMTYLEHRERPFVTIYSRRPIYVASNLTLLATFNPRDRSAIEIDAALLRRLRIMGFPPSIDQLSEMLTGSALSQDVIKKIQNIFTQCKSKNPESYEHLMPFGHGIFADVKNEQPDLHRLWIERIVHLLKRPLVDPHPFTDVISTNYPWKDSNFRLS